MAQHCTRLQQRTLCQSTRRLAGTIYRGDHRSRPPDRRSASPSLGPRRPALHDRGHGRRHRLRPQHRRHRLCRLPLDVPRDGPEAFRPVGEVEFANGVAAMAASGGYGKARDVRRHRQPRQSAARRRRQSRCWKPRSSPAMAASAAFAIPSAWDADPDVAGMYATRPKGLLLDATFRKGFACLAPLGLSFDAWLFHPQIGELTDLARAFPETKIVLDHCGGPIGIGSYAGRREEIFPDWKASIQEIAKCQNVVVKLGGLAMCLLGYDFHLRPKPPSSEEAAAAWRPYIETCIEAFGPDPLHVREQFPAGQRPVQLSGDLQRLQAPRRAIQRGREDRDVLEDGDGFLQAEAGSDDGGVSDRLTPTRPCGIPARFDRRRECRRCRSRPSRSSSRCESGSCCRLAPRSAPGQLVAADEAFRVALAERDMRGGVLVEQRVEEQQPAFRDRRGMRHQRHFAETCARPRRCRAPSSAPPRRARPWPRRCGLPRTAPAMLSISVP